LRTLVEIASIQEAARRSGRHRLASLPARATFAQRSGNEHGFAPEALGAVPWIFSFFVPRIL
jgi:hypothetical protein